ncbi:hypothetical protein GGU11DRAFT_713808 [Lentinula aff. detonsa]|nr:hypothetical protein GGU11DRAFT_713808 [Lentinula aff. detonsa]
MCGNDCNQHLLAHLLLQMKLHSQRSTSSTPPPRSERGPYSTSSRGRACGSCRRRKVKCDGVKPTCSQCLRLPPSELTENKVCEYSDPKLRRTEEQDLKDNIKTLEARIRELETSSDASAVRLHSPYQVEHCYPENVLGLPLQDVNLPSPRLLEVFFRHATELGFFLHIPRFRYAVMLPVDSPGRPCQGLISAALLLGSSLTKEYTPEFNFHSNPLFVSDDGVSGATTNPQEALYLSQAQTGIAGILLSSHPDRIVHGIQAELLLSIYLLRQGRILEGKYHLSAATSIAFGAKLHKIRSSNRDRDMLTSAALPWVVNTPSSPCQSAFHLNVGSEVLLSSPPDSISEGERINAFWTVVTMSNCWALAADSSPNFILERYIENIDTPWPMDIEEYGQNSNSEHPDSATVAKFLQSQQRPSCTPRDTGDREYSALEMCAQASILLSRAATVALAYQPNMSSSVAAKFTTSFLDLDRLIDHFKETRLHISSSNLSSSVGPNDSRKSMHFSAHMIAHLATIVLHNKVATMTPTSDSLTYSVPSDSGQKRLEAAETIAELCRNRWSLKAGKWRESGRSLSANPDPDPNPFLGCLWLAVGQVLIEEIGLVRIISNGNCLLDPEESDSDRVSTSEREAELLDKLDCIFESAQLSRAYHSPLANYLFEKLQKIYRSRLQVGGISSNT